MIGIARFDIAWNVSLPQDRASSERRNASARVLRRELGERSEARAGAYMLHMAERATDERRLALRAPNRKFKVPRWVLAQRLGIFWLSVYKLRKLILLHFGYDPDCQNIDQSHTIVMRREARSAARWH